jgi:hypothetical protein
LSRSWNTQLFVFNPFTDKSMKNYYNFNNTKIIMY